MASSESKLSQLRLLILSPCQAAISAEASSPKPPAFPPLLESLTHVAPSADLISFAGYTSHQPLHIKTKYYEKDVSIWCDELPRTVDFSKASKVAGTGAQETEEAPDLAQWQEQMTSAPAREVRDAIGGIILVLPVGSHRVAAKPDEHSTVYIQAVNHLRQMIEDESGGRDVASVIVLQPAEPATPASKDSHVLKQLRDFSNTLEEWCHSQGFFGWDFVYWDAQNITEDIGDSIEKNEFGEKIGIERVKEALEAVDWNAPPASEVDDPDLEKDGPDVFSSDRFHSLDAELQQEMMALKLSMINEKSSSGRGDEEDMSSDQMQELMHRVVAIRDAGVDLPREERQAFAKREVEKIIRELS